MSVTGARPGWADRLANWKLFAILIVIFLACSYAFAWRREVLAQGAGLLDLRFWYTPVEALGLLAELGPDGRWLYAITQLTLDLVYPVAYAGLLCILILWGYPGRVGSSLCAVPLVGALADVGENAVIAYLALGFTGRATDLAWVASTFTATKWLLVTGSVVLALFGGFRRLLRRAGAGTQD